MVKVAGAIPALPESMTFNKRKDCIAAFLLIGKWRDVIIISFGPDGKKEAKATGEYFKNMYYAILYVFKLLRKGKTVIIQKKIS